jgi:phage anti-repressor protein
VAIHESQSSITSRTFWNCLIMAIRQRGCAVLPLAAEISAIIERATVAQSPSGRDEHGRTQVPTVSARNLHTFLDVGRFFANWIKDRIDAFGFVEGQDYVVVDGLSLPDLASSKSRPQATKEYFLSIDMAKELSMVERNEKGRTLLLAA